MTDLDTRRTRAGTVGWTWLLAAALVVTGLLALGLRPVPPPAAGGALDGSLTSFPAATLDRVAAWVGPIRTARLLSIALALVVPAALLGTSRGRALLRRLGGRRAAGWRGAAAVVVLTALAGAPLRWWIGWHHAGAFGFRTSTPTRFVVEELGALAVEVAVVATGAALLLWLIRRRPTDWPAVGVVTGTLLTGLLALVAPFVTTQLLLTPTPLDDGPVLDAVAPVVAASSLDDPLVEVGDASVRTTRVNAFVTGYGPARRVVLYDTLVALGPDRVAAVVGHELAHAEHRDVERAVLGSAAGIALAMLVVALGRGALVGRGVRLDPAVSGAALVAVFVVLELVTAPVVAWESRRAEAAADQRALELTRDPATQVAVHRGFVLEDLADPAPPTWVRLLSSHPTPAERIRAAAGFAETAGLDPVPADPDPVPADPDPVAAADGVAP